MHYRKKFAVNNCVASGIGEKQHGILGTFNPIPWEKQCEVADRNSGKSSGGNEHTFTLSSVFSLFRYADKVDIALMWIGLVVAIANGAMMPAISVVFGKMADVFLSVEKLLHDPRFRDNSTSPIRMEHVHSSSNSFNSSGSGEIFFNEAYFFSEVAVLTYYYLGLACVSFVASFIQVYCWEAASERQIYRLRRVYFSQILRQDVGWFDQNKDGDLASKLTDDFERMRNGLGSKVPTTTQNVSQLFLGLLIGFYTSWKLSLVLCATAPLLLASSAFAAVTMSGSSMREQLRYGVASGIATEVLTCIKTIVAFGGELHEANRYNAVMEEGRRQTKSKYYALAISMAAMYGISYSVDALGFWYGSSLFLNGEIKPGQIFTVLFSVLVAASAIGNSLPVLAEIANAIGATSVVFKIIDQVPIIDVYSSEGTIPHKTEGQIVFKDVRFNYPTRPDVQVLKGLNLKIGSGKVVAFVGSSGVGKSTLVSLLMRFYDPTGGAILIDGENIKDMNLNWLRSQIGVVSQEPVLFGVSIAENIRYGNRDAAQEDIVKAAKLANAHRFITAFPQGYDTLVGDLGAMMSGGQKQRIAIARALLRDPKILLLDEATSALDAESEAAVQSALNNAMSGRTTIIIAHRLSTVRDVDTIYAMQDGLVCEQGTHDELMKKEGLYYNLVMIQRKNSQQTEVANVDARFVESKLQACMESLAINRKRSSSRSLKNSKETEESGQPDDPKVSFCDLFRLSTAQWPLLFIAVVCCTFLGFHIPLLSVIYGQVLQVFLLTGDAFYSSIGFLCGALVLLAILTSINQFIAVMCSCTATEKLVQLLRVEAFKNILSQQISWFDEECYSPLRLTNTLAKDPPLIKVIAGMRVGVILMNIITLFATVGIAFYSNWKLAIIVSTALPLLVVISWKQSKLKMEQYSRELSSMEDASKLASECIQNVRTVHLLGIQEFMSQMYSDKLLHSHLAAKKQGLYFSVVYSLTRCSLYILYAIAYKFGACLVDSGEMRTADLYRTLFSVGFSFTSLGNGCIYMQDFVKGKSSVAKVFKLLKVGSTLNTFSGEGLTPEIKGKVTFKNVGFRYPNRKDTPVLQGFDLNVEVGQTVAIVGGSGCGKSTIVALLERFYSPEMGQILVDDVDVTMLNVVHLRKSIGVVTQEPVLIDCSIRDNIAYGLIGTCEQAIDTQVIEAAKRANIHEFIIRLPMGYDTPAGDRGTQLSGGQKQRIAIARALIREPKILLLDEATSALDNESEQIVQEALDKASQGRTSIIIAHRLSSIRGADLIVVLDEGKVVEKGTHEQLKNLQGHYYNLIKKQEDEKY